MSQPNSVSRTERSFLSSLYNRVPMFVGFCYYALAGGYLYSEYVPYLGEAQIRHLFVFYAIAVTIWTLINAVNNAVVQLPTKDANLLTTIGAYTVVAALFLEHTIGTPAAFVPRIAAIAGLAFVMYLLFTLYLALLEVLYMQWTGEEGQPLEPEQPQTAEPQPESIDPIARRVLTDEELRNWNTSDE